MKTVLILCVVAALLGCVRNPARVSVDPTALLPGATADAPKDNGTPATVNSSGEQDEIVIPAGTELTVTRTEAVPATQHAVFKPASEVWTWSFSSATHYRRKAQATTASSGTIDTSVAKHRLDNAARAPLLWVAAACIVVGLVVAVVLKHPAIGGMIAIGGGGGAIAAWKLADVPAWLWGVGLVMALIAWAFYWRGQRDADGNGVPDKYERKPIS